jgi:hypothetical protein
MSIEVNLDGVEAWSGVETLPEGWHVVVIREVKEIKSGSGTPGLEFTLEATEGEFRGARVRDYQYVTERSYGAVRQKLEAARYPIPSGKFAIDLVRLRGRSVRVLVREEVFDGKPRARVKSWEPADATSGNSDMPAPAAVGGGAASYHDDEIPFAASKV